MSEQQNFRDEYEKSLRMVREYALKEACKKLRILKVDYYVRGLVFLA